jgi:hypothetical protein
MVTKGRPKLPEGESLVHITLRLPKWLIDWYGSGSLKRSTRMRRALEDYACPDEEQD